VHDLVHYAVVTLLVALALLPAAAGASPRQYALFQDEALLVENGGTRAGTLDEIRSLGVDMIKGLFSAVDPHHSLNPGKISGSD